MFVSPNILISPFLTPFLWLNHKCVFSMWDCLSLWKYVHFYEFSDDISDILGHLSLAFWLTSRCVIISRLIFGAAYAILLLFFMTNIPMCPYTTSSLSIHLFMDLFFASMSWLLQYCCSAYLPASAFPILLVLGYRPERCPAASYGSSIFTF